MLRTVTTYEQHALAEDIDTTIRGGRLAFRINPQFQKERISKRKKEGLPPARKRYRAGPLPSHLLDPKRTKGGAKVWSG